MKKTLVTVILAVVMALSCCITAFAGWETDGAEFKYTDQYGNYVVNRIEAIDGQKYGFDTAGHMVKGWAKFDNQWYYFDKTTGAMQTGWLQDNGKWYYMSLTTGAMMTGFITDGNKKYCLGDDGVMKTGEIQYQGSCYKAGTDGVIIRNKIETLSDGKTYKYDDAGIIWYKNNKSRAVNSSEWLPLGSTAKADFDYTNYGNSVNDILQKYYERYVAAMKNKKSAADKREYRAEWEARVIEELNAVEVENVAPGLTASYIYDVERNRYSDYTSYFEKFYEE